MSAKQPPPGMVLAICGAALQIGVAFVPPSVLPGLVNAFSTLGTSGLGDPTSLAGAVGEVLAGSALGLALGLLGLVLLCLALVSSRYRAAWFFWFLFIYGILLLAAFPVGTASGIFFLVYIRAHRREFGAASSPVPTV